MGANQSLQYSVAITNNNKPGETEIYRNPLTKDKLIPFPSPEIRTTSDIVQQGAKKFAKCNCLGIY